MENLLITTLTKSGYPVFLQGSLLPDEPFPDDFYTFWEHESYSDSFYDNSETSLVHEYDVNFYSSDPEKVYTVLREAACALKQVGFIISGDGHSVPSGTQTHTGRGMTVKFLQCKN